MKKALLLIIGIILVLCVSSFAQETLTDMQTLTKDITILKILNLFSLNKQQIEKTITIFQEGLVKRTKNLNEIRTALIKGKKYGELTDNLKRKLDKTNAKIVSEFEAILNPDQKKVAQMLFDLITDDEMKLVMEMGPTLLELITGRLKVLQDLGILTISSETSSSLMQTMAPLALEILDQIQSMVKEASISLLVQTRTIELLKEKLNVPEEVKPKEPEKPAKRKKPTGK